MTDQRPTRALDGKCALITGSVRGLGLAAAERFAAAGCDLVLHGFDGVQEVSTLRSGLESRHGVRTIYSDADLRHPDAVTGMIAAAGDAFGRVDILVNNAVVRHQAPVESFGTTEWDEALAVNVSAAFHAIRLTVPGMKQAGWGRIINVSSIYGLRGAVNRVGYVTSKTALIGLTRAVALDTLAHGITCNAVCPGTAKTPIHEVTVVTAMSELGLARADAERRVLQGKQPSGRFVSVDGVAALMVFLCGPDGGDITGAALPVDGGWSAS